MATTDIVIRGAREHNLRDVSLDLLRGSLIYFTEVSGSGKSSLQQMTGGRNPRSTVGTITEINDYLRVLYARVGQGHCPRCDRPVAAQTREQILARVLDLPDGTAYSVMAPVIRGLKGEF